MPTALPMSSIPDTILEVSSKPIDVALYHMLFQEFWNKSKYKVDTESFKKSKTGTRNVKARAKVQSGVHSNAKMGVESELLNFHIFTIFDSLKCWSEVTMDSL